MSKKEKSKRPLAKLPRGFRDEFGEAVRARRELLERLARLYELYGFEALETGAVERLDVLGKYLPDIDRPGEGVFAWEDSEEGWLGLRYDLTAPLARVAAAYRNDITFPYRRYAMGPVWRHEKPGPGRYRQFTQCDADTTGSTSPAADAEMITLTARALESAGIARGEYVVRINSRGILNGVLEAAGIFDPANPEAGESRRGIVLRTIDKFDRFGEQGVRALLGPGRRDQSGDFTKGAELSSEAIERILAFVNAAGESDGATLAALSALVGESEAGLRAIEEIGNIMALVRAEGFDEQSVRVDPGIVRGLGYYTGAVYEAGLQGDRWKDAASLGSVAAGGRYDELVMRFTGQKLPAVGTSIGVDRLLAALAHGEEAKARTGPVIVTVMDRDQLARYQAMVRALQGANIRAELYLGNPRDFGKQLKYADARGAPFAVIQGTSEREAGEVLVKDLELGARLSEGIEDRAEWAAQPAQVSVKEDALVDYLATKLQSR